MTFFKVKENITAVIAALIAIIALLTSFIGTDGEVYLFPRIAAVIIAILAASLLIKVFMNRDTEVVMTSSLIEWKTLLPSLVIGLIYLICLEIVGFYVSSFVAFFAIVAVYGKRHMLDPKRGLFKLGVATIFMIVLFLLFWNLLHVRTPTGFLI
ncbi:MAG: tripartite tricarboxylate transporter TctB family protein [Cocleimonas sp.]